MSESKDVKFDLKIVINKQKNKVVFAEADSSFIDVMLSFLTMPLGTVVRVLKNHYGGDETPAIGSLTSLYHGLANLDSANFWTEGCKVALLNPTSPFEAECRKLKLDISDTQPPAYLSCQNTRCGLRNFEPFSAMYCQSMYYDTAKCHCGQLMTREAGQKKYWQADNDAGAVFTINTTTSSFIISDDLQIFPDITGFVQILRNLGISDTDGTEPRNVTFGFNEIMALLKTSLLSRTPLTDFILDKRQIYSGRTTYEAGVSLHQIRKEATSNSRKMNLKVILHKSTNKLLFAQADDDFVDFLCSLLAVPLGGVEHLCGGSACLNSIDNLYRSIANIDDKYLATPDMKTGLVKPKLRHGYIPENPILPLTEESHSPTIRISKRVTIPFSSQRFPNGQGKYVRGPRMYKLTDDLTVTPFCMAATLSVLDGLNIPVSDLQDLQLEIGSEEALSILKASLTSSSALTDGLLINTMLRKQPKQEH